MYESPEEIAALQELIDRSSAPMSPHMASILAPERRLNASQVITYMQGVKHVAFATVNARGEPRVAPLDGLFIHGRIHVSTGGRAARLRHLRRNPAVSVTHFQSDEIAVMVHGRALIFEREHPEIAELEPIYVEVYGSSPFSWGEGVVLIRVEPDEMFTYAPYPERFPKS
jgi:uncharacterized pyridoxamine 5'-phosphate oxidase family protein